MRYTWTDSKNRRNLKLHGIAFENAVSIFDGPTLEQEDDRFDYGERRVYAIGVVNGLEITVILPTGNRRSAGSFRLGARNRMSAARTGGASRN